MKSLWAVLIAAVVFAPAADLSLTVEPMPSPAAASTAEPRMTVERGRTILSWLELAGKHTSLKFAERSASGWSDVRAAAAGDDFSINAVDVPAVRRLADNSLVAQWLVTDGPDPESSKLQLSWSTDDGRSWSTPLTPHHDKVVTQHAFASLYQVPGSGLGIVWLDGRAIKPGAPEGVGNMALRAATFDPSGRQLKEQIVDARVCECCSTDAAATDEGVIVAYRNRSAGDIRDIYVTRLVTGRWTQPVAVHHDGWKIEGCPVNGPAISAHGRDVAVAWFTGKDDIGHTFVAFSKNGGRTFGQAIRVDEGGSGGRVGVELLDDHAAAVTWVEAANEKSFFAVRRVETSGDRGPVTRVGDSGGVRYPRISRSGDELLFAWTESERGTPQVKTARASIR